MNPQDLPLEDIHLPESVSFWPPAPGWFLAALILIACYVAYVAIKRYRASRVQQKLAMAELQQIDLQNFDAWQKINDVLKRACLAYCSREEVAQLNGQQWRDFLLGHMSNNKADFDDQWLHFAYSNKVQHDQVYLYHSFAQQWLKVALPIKRGRT